MPLRPPVIALLALLLAASLGWSHYTWLVRTHYSASGDTAYLELGHGHDFPVSEEAPATTHLKAFLVGEDGSRKPVKMATTPKSLKLEAKLASKKLARVYYVRDRGVMSQTSGGWKDGGRDQFPDAKASRKILQYGIAWVGFTGTTNSSAPLGLELELNYESGLRGRMVRAWRKGKPAREGGSDCGIGRRPRDQAGQDGSGWLCEGAGNSAGTGARFVHRQRNGEVREGRQLRRRRSFVQPGAARGVGCDACIRWHSSG
ncbi:MAG: hypothetical protein U5J83_13180 [Bryobacterales bacterium]|nr:hypothetical protein [Bryobacterales bacterium]